MSPDSRRSLLITEGAGFLGAEVARAALERGWSVTVLDGFRAEPHLRPFSSSGLLRRLRAELSPDITYLPLRVIRGEYSHPDVLAHVLPDIDAVSHVAEPPTGAWQDDSATAMLLAEMTRHGVHELVLASTAAVFAEGAYRDEIGPVAVRPRSPADLRAGGFDFISARTAQVLTPEWLTEDVTAQPLTRFGKLCRARELLAFDWAQSTGGRVAVVRFQSVYGPRMQQSSVCSEPVAAFLSQLQCGRSPQVPEDGRQLRDFIHVADAAQAALAAQDWTASAESSRFRIFHVGSGTAHTLAAAAELMARAADGPSPVAAGTFHSSEPRHLLACSQRIRDELGWVPRIGLWDGLMRLVRHQR